MAFSFTSGTFVAEKLLGSGGSGQVHLVRDTVSGARFATKTLQETGSERLTRFRNEFLTLGSIRHDSIVQAFDYWAGDARNPPVFSMEFVDGADIVDTIRAEGLDGLPRFLGEALAALEFLHCQGIIHRDIKPENILIRKRPRAGVRTVLVDLGLAFQPARSPERAPAGTLPFLAPELLRGGEPSIQSDLYSLGAVAYEVVTGHPPFDFESGDLGMWLTRVDSGVDPSLLEYVAPSLRSWILALLHPDPSRRPVGAAEARSILMQGLPDVEGRLERTNRRARLLSGPPAARENTIAELWRRLDSRDEPALIFVIGEPGFGIRHLFRFLRLDAVARGWEVLHESEISSDATVPASSKRVAFLHDVAAATPDQAAFLEGVVEGNRHSHAVVGIRSSMLRDERIANYARSAGAHPRIEKVQLVPFDCAATETFLIRAGVNQREAERSAEAWCDAAHGVPARLYELWAGLDAPVVPRLEDVSSTTRGLDSESIDRQIRSCSESALQTLNALALLPAGSDPRLVARVARLQPAELLAAEQELEALGILFQIEGAFRFTANDWSRQICSRLWRDSSSWFCQAADIYSGWPDADAVWLGQLEVLAGRLQSGVDRLVKSAEQAASKKDRVSVLRVCESAIRILPRDTELRGRFWRLRADALFEKGLHALAHRSYSAAARYARDEASLRHIGFRRIFSLITVGKLKPASAALRAIASSDAARLSDSEHAFLELYVGYREGKREESVRTSDSVLSGKPPPNVAIETLQVRGLCASLLRQNEIADEAFREAIRLGTPDLLERQQILPRLGLALHFNRTERVSESLKILDEAESLLGASDADRIRLFLLDIRLRSNLTLRRMGAANSDADEFSDIAARLGDIGALLDSQRWKSDIALYLGRYAIAESIAARILASEFSGSDPTRTAYTWIGRAIASLKMGRDGRKRAEQFLESSRRVLSPDIRVARIRFQAEIDLALAGNDWTAAGKLVEDYEAELANGDPLESEGRIELQVAKLQLLSAQDAWPFVKGVDAVIQSSLTAGMPDHAAVACAIAVGAAMGSPDRSSAQDYHRQGNQALQQAAELLPDPRDRNDFLARPEFRILRAPLETGEQEGERLVAVYRMIHALNSESDPEALLDSMLDMALEVVEAERGMVLLRGSDGEFRARVARNLEQETIKDAEEFSRSVVSEAVAGRAVLAMDTGHDERLKDFKSVSVFGIRSLICVPLRSGAQIIGAVYLDNRKEGALFNTDDLRFLEAFADHAALALRNAQRESHLTRENKRLRVLTESRDRFDDIVGRSQPMQEIYDLIERFAETALPVMIFGESGTGKELIAKAIHRHGPRRKKAYLTENCASITETLLEAELFGHVKGAFTGADRDRPGLFLEAHKGTLFLDEIGDMPASMQARLLRVLQEGELRRVGGNQIEKVDVRILAATHRDLASRVVGGQFREDLLFRLQVLQINVPPLRDRQGDVPMLVEHFLERIGKARGGDPIKMFNNVMDLLERYPWPGNVRELENVLQRVCVLSGGKPIRMELIESNESLRRLFLDRPATPKAMPTLATREREQILEALERTGGNKAKAAKLLGVSRATFFRRLKQYEI